MSGIYSSDEEIEALTDDERSAVWDAESANIVFADRIAEVMALNGAKVLVGDVLNALKSLGLMIVNADQDADPHDYESASGTFNSLIEEDDCPKCGGERRRLRNPTHTIYGNPWWHRRDWGGGYGYMRRCAKEAQP